MLILRGAGVTGVLASESHTTVGRIPVRSVRGTAENQIGQTVSPELPRLFAVVHFY